MAIIDDKVKLIEGSIADFIKRMMRMNTLFANNLIEELSVLISGIDLPTNQRFLGNIESLVFKALRTSGYGLVADNFIKDFKAVDSINRLLHKEVNDININSIINENQKLSAFLNSFKIDLKGIQSKSQRSLLLAELITPIAEIIRKDALVGVSLKDATKNIRKKIVEGNLGLDRWAGQIARDGMRQYDGRLQNEIRKTHNMEYFNYVGTIVEGTRPFCFDMLTQDRDYWDIPSLQKMLDEYIPNGVPSDVSITYYPLGKKKIRKKGSGMIPGTTVDNFPTVTGGYNCDDTYLPRKRKPRGAE